MFCFFSFSCASGDYLKMFLHLDPEIEGVNEYTPWSGLLCGNITDIPQVLYSSGPSLVFEFHAETNSHRTNAGNLGFSGSYRFIDKSKSHLL